MHSRENYFLPKAVLRKVFRGKFVAALRQAFRDGQLRFPEKLKLLSQPKIFAAWLRPLFRQDWVVYLKRPFGGPEYVLHYLGRYTHRVAISNHRLVSFADGQVTFRWRDSAHQQQLTALSHDQFLRRFLLHLLPEGFVRIRHFGFLACRRRSTTLPLCFQLLGVAQEPLDQRHAPSPEKDQPDLYRCPKCGGPMKVIERLTASEILFRSPPGAPASRMKPLSPTRSLCVSPRAAYLSVVLPNKFACKPLPRPCWPYFLVSDASFLGALKGRAPQRNLGTLQSSPFFLN